MKFYRIDKSAIDAVSVEAETVEWFATQKSVATQDFVNYSDDTKNCVRVWMRYCGLKREGDIQPTIFKVCVQTNKLLAGLEAYESVFYTFENQVDAQTKYDALVAETGAIKVPDEPKDAEEP